MPKKIKIMKWLLNLTDKLNLLYGSIFFVKNHFPIIFGLGLIAAFGRVIQLGGFGEIPSWASIGLEVVVETARVLIFLFVLGIASLKRGAYQVKRLFTQRSNLRTYWSIAKKKMKTQWIHILLSFFGFLIIAGVVNFLIDTLAYETCLYLTLKREGMLVDNTSEWTILLFFKNISVIPFTIVFETILLIWLTSEETFRHTPSRAELQLDK
jgi:hypothetical protein